MVGIRLPAGTERAEGDGAGGDGEKNEAGKNQILSDRARHKRHAVFLRELVIFLQISRAANDASGHRPFVDSEFQHKQQMQADEGKQQIRESQIHAARRIWRAWGPR